MKRAILFTLGWGMALGACAQDESWDPPPQQTKYYVEVTTEQGIDGQQNPFSRATVTYADFEQSEFPRVKRTAGCVMVDFRESGGYPDWSPTAGRIRITSERGDSVMMNPLTQIDGLFLVRGLPLYAQWLPLWDPSERIVVVAEGAEIPSFSATLRFPKPVTMKSSSLRAAGSPGVVDSCRRITLEWEPTEEQEVGLQFVQHRPDALHLIDYSVKCTFPGSFREGVIPDDALDDLDTDDMLDDGRSRTEVFAIGQTSTFIKEGEYEIVVSHKLATGRMVDIE